MGLGVETMCMHKTHKYAISHTNWYKEGKCGECRLQTRRTHSLSEHTHRSYDKEETECKLRDDNIFINCFPVSLTVLLF